MKKKETRMDNLIFDEIDLGNFYWPNGAIIKTENYYCEIDNNGKILFKTLHKFKRLSPKYLQFDLENKILITDNNFNIIFESEDKNIEYWRDYLIFKENNKQGLMDFLKKILIPNEYDEILFYSFDEKTKTLPAKKNGKWGVIDLNNNIVIDFKYLAINWQEDTDIAFVQDKNNNWGVINKQGKSISFDLKNVEEI